MRRLLALGLVPLLLFVAACSDDDGDTEVAAGPTAAATTATAATAEATAPPTDAASISGTVTIDFAGAPEEREMVSEDFEVDPGTTAWEAIQLAIAEENLSYEDFGGDLGIFISGFYGVEVEGNNFWEFSVNGESSELGVSAYEVQDGDVLGFAYSSF